MELNIKQIQDNLKILQENNKPLNELIKIYQDTQALIQESLHKLSEYEQMVKQEINVDIKKKKHTNIENVINDIDRYSKQHDELDTLKDIVTNYLKLHQSVQQFMSMYHEKKEVKKI